MNTEPKKERKKRSPEMVPREMRTLESWAIKNGKRGMSFYSDKKDRHITAIATHIGRKILTERLITVTAGKAAPVAKYITKVTLI